MGPIRISVSQLLRPSQLEPAAKKAELGQRKAVARDDGVARARPSSMQGIGNSSQTAKLKKGFSDFSQKTALDATSKDAGLQRFKMRGDELRADAAKLAEVLGNPASSDAGEWTSQVNSLCMDGEKKAQWLQQDATWKSAQELWDGALDQALTQLDDTQLDAVATRLADDPSLASPSLRQAVEVQQLARSDALDKALESTQPVAATPGSLIRAVQVRAQMLGLDAEAIGQMNVKGLHAMQTDNGSADPGLREIAEGWRQARLRCDAPELELQSKPARLGEGAASGFTHSIRETSADSEGVLIPSRESPLPVSRAATIGLNGASPRSLERMWFASALDGALNLHVAGKANVVLHQDEPVLTLQWDEHAKPVGQNSTGTMQRDLMAMQCLDVVMGTANRHHNGYLITTNDHGEAVGARITDFGLSMGIRSPQRLPMPPVLDRNMADALQRLSAQDVRNMANGLFEEQAVDSAVERLLLLKQHVQDLEARGRIISPDQWGSNQVGQWLEEPPQSSAMNYWQRDHARFNRGFEDAF